MHRVMNEKYKCFNIHGHTYLFELRFQFAEIEKIGYAIDFKEIKRIGCTWIDDILDHGAILNPKDTEVLKAVHATNSKYWVMSLNGTEYCNPSVENIAKEIYLAMYILFDGLAVSIERVRLYETPNCYTDCYSESIADEEMKNFYQARKYQIEEYARHKGTITYYDEEKTK